MPDGGTLRLEVTPLGGDVALRVHDTGSGMDRTVSGRCFEPLFTTKGSGQGIRARSRISRDILQEAGGHIELHSTAGHGTTAVVALPAATVGRATAEPGRAA